MVEIISTTSNDNSTEHREGSSMTGWCMGA